MKYLVALCLALNIGCASKAPPNIEPGGLPLWQANEVQLAFGALQRTAIGLNGIQRCDAATPPVCAPLVSDTNTRAVIEVTEDVVVSLRAVPDGWKATALAALERVKTRLDAAGQAKLASYLTMIGSVIGGL